MSKRDPVASKPIQPGQTIGIYGGGQLGRMLAMVARRSGYRVHVFSDASDSPAALLANQVTCAAYDDVGAFRKFAAEIDTLTLEFENVCAAALDAVPQHVPIRPGKNVLVAAQNRANEKSFLSDHRIPTPPFAVVHSLDELRSALVEVGVPSVLKTARGGYDGKGQYRIDTPDQAEQAWSELRGETCTLEAFVDLACEVSVIVARDVFGTVADFGVIENQHENHILDLSFTPSHLPKAQADEARLMADRIAQAFEMVGLICIEFFVTRSGQVLVNEIAPRPHNSGHLTIEGFSISQFEQQLRCVCGLPVARPKLIRPSAMVNLLGDRWFPNPPHWARMADVDETYLHLYEKADAKPGRKMGHITACADDVSSAIRRAMTARDSLGGK